MARGFIVVNELQDGTKSYSARIRLGLNRKQRAKTFKLRKDAVAYLDRFSTDCREGTYRELIPGTFEEYANRWKRNNLIPEELKPSTLNGYNSVLEKHLISYFGPRPISAIGTADVSDFRSLLLKSKLSPKTVRNVLNLLHRIFADAKQDAYV